MWDMWRASTFTSALHSACLSCAAYTSTEPPKRNRLLVSNRTPGPGAVRSDGRKEGAAFVLLRPGRKQATSSVPAGSASPRSHAGSCQRERLMTSDGFSSARIPPSLQTGHAALASGGGSNRRRMVDVGGSLQAWAQENIDVVAEDALRPGARSQAGPRWPEREAAVVLSRMLRRRMRRKKMQAGYGVVTAALVGGQATLACGQKRLLSLQFPAPQVAGRLQPYREEE
ncbi:hypothetical protein OPV22_013480 [Ensete ventricosum]|uniref:Uncharacterized protein n=1 Tax=Ensete ventricosum TaxID=4639 RepID=A0AAV8R0Y7_ENSVE|nr:hypothetical protein OPV22_013480 [Ensete ventricosum]